MQAANAFAAAAAGVKGEEEKWLGFERGSRRRGSCAPAVGLLAASDVAAASPAGKAAGLRV